MAAQIKFSVKSPNGRVTIIDEAEATRLLIDKYGHSDYIQAMKERKELTASVSGGMLRKA